MIRKDYKRQFGAFLFSTAIALMVLLFLGLNAWVMALVIWVLAYAGGYHAILEWDAKTKIADTDKL